MLYIYIVFNAFNMLMSILFLKTYYFDVFFIKKYFLKNTLHRIIKHILSDILLNMKD
jgi:hypothetical protein